MNAREILLYEELALNAHPALQTQFCELKINLTKKLDLLSPCVIICHFPQVVLLQTLTHAALR